MVRGSVFRSVGIKSNCKTLKRRRCNGAQVGVERESHVDAAVLQCPNGPAVALGIGHPHWTASDLERLSEALPDLRYETG